MNMSGLRQVAFHGSYRQIRRLAKNARRPGHLGQILIVPVTQPRVHPDSELESTGENLHLGQGTIRCKPSNSSAFRVNCPLSSINLRKER